MRLSFSVLISGCAYRLGFVERLLAFAGAICSSFKFASNALLVLYVVQRPVCFVTYLAGLSFVCVGRYPRLLFLSGLSSLHCRRMSKLKKHSALNHDPVLSNNRHMQWLGVIAKSLDASNNSIPGSPSSLAGWHGNVISIGSVSHDSSERS